MAGWVSSGAGANTPGSAQFSRTVEPTSDYGRVLVSEPEAT